MADANQDNLVNGQDDQPNGIQNDGGNEQNADNSSQPTHPPSHQGSADGDHPSVAGFDPNDTHYSTPRDSPRNSRENSPERRGDRLFDDSILTHILQNYCNQVDNVEMRQNLETPKN